MIRTCVDFVMLWAASTAAVLGAGQAHVAQSWWLAVLYPLLVLLLIHARPSPDRRMNPSLVDTEAHVIGVVSLAAMLTIAVDSIVGDHRPVSIAVRLWLFALVYLGVARAVLGSIERWARSTGSLSTPTLIVGAGVVGEQVVRRLAARREYGLQPVGFLDADPPLADPGSVTEVPLLGSPQNLPEAVRQTGARHVILAFTSEPDHVLVETIRACDELGLGVSVVPRFYESINEHATLDHLGGLPLLALHDVDPKGWQFASKHAFDRVVALIGLLSLAPIMIAIAIAVRLSSPGPILFRQRRVGRDGNVFDVYKFRTMMSIDDLGSERFALPDDTAPGGVEGRDRRTALGRFLRDSSLDELPQLLNVLRGEMSLVGPRPERPEFVELFARNVHRYDDRHRVKSGITGWAQVNGLRGRTSIADRVEWDNHYIRNWSLWFDLRILALTVCEVLKFREPGIAIRAGEDQPTPLVAPVGE
jgi:exopolysaccharide biosynthesis polyprenyl glycosylphosphotransferase